jgi:two-component system, OmpR family, response regulator
MNASPHILVIEDDAEINRLVSRYLRGNDFHVSVAPDGRNLDRLLEDNRVDLIVLDLMLPGEDGLSLCRRLRTHSAVPVIMLTAKGDELDRIIGLEMGADDYLTKPFNPRELMARIRAVLRRASANLQPAERHARKLSFIGWQIDCVLRELRDPNGTRIVLTGAEFCLLQVMCERAGRVLSRDQLLDLTQTRAAGSLGRSIDVLISRLRRKIERDLRDPEIIKTVRSGGYLFAPMVEAA